MLNTQDDTVSELIPNQEFAKLASDEQIERAAKALEANGIHTLIAKNGAEAKRIFFELVPERSEVFLGASITLETLGIKDQIDKSGRYEALRPKMFAMDRKTLGQGNPQIRRRTRLRSGQCPRRDRGWSGDDCFEDRQSTGSICLRGGKRDLGRRGAKDRQGFE